MPATMLHSRRYGTLDPARLEAFEREIGFALPDAYRTFLLEHNGGIPQPGCFEVPEDFDEGNVWSEREVACFFAVHDQTWDDSTPEGSLAYPLQAVWRDIAGAPPGDHRLFPIGKDWSGNYLCIGYAGEETDGIYFWDHEWETVTRVADSFDAFLDRLHVCEPSN